MIAVDCWKATASTTNTATAATTVHATAATKLGWGRIFLSPYQEDITLHSNTNMIAVDCWNATASTTTTTATTTTTTTVLISTSMTTAILWIHGSWM